VLVGQNPKPTHVGAFFRFKYFILNGVGGVGGVGAKNRYILMEEEKKISKQYSSSELDQVIFYLARSNMRYYKLNPEQAEKVKAAWEALHAYDQDHEYTFNETHTILRKDQR
jgi:hypothetical protein